MKSLAYIFILFVLFSCGSTAVKTEEQTHHDEGNRVELSDAQYTFAHIEWGTMIRKPMGTIISANGMLDVPPQNLVSINAMVGGFVKSTQLLQGMKVKKGEVLAVIQNPELIQWQQDYLENSNKVIYAEQEFQRQQKLTEENISAGKNYQMAQSEFFSLKAKQKALEEKLKLVGISVKTLTPETITSEMNVRAPIDGYVTVVNINIGKYVSPQDLICEIVDTKHLHVELTVFEQDLSKLKIGQKIRFTLINEPNEERVAEIYLINKKIAEDRTVRVHAHLEKEDPDLVPNMYLKAFIETGKIESLTLPEEAVVTAGNKSYLYIKAGKEVHKPGDSEGKEEGEEPYAFEAIEVAKGNTVNGFVEIKQFSKPLTEKDSVVVKGAYEILSVSNNTEEEGHGH